MHIHEEFTGSPPTETEQLLRGCSFFFFQTHKNKEIRAERVNEKITDFFSPPTGASTRSLCALIIAVIIGKGGELVP